MNEIEFGFHSLAKHWVFLLETTFSASTCANLWPVANAAANVGHFWLAAVIYYETWNRAGQKVYLRPIPPVPCKRKVKPCKFLSKDLSEFV